MNSPVIVIENLAFSYGGPPLLEDVNLSIREGEFVSVVGPNGGGKTTLLKLILGLLLPSRGTVRVFGKRPEDARRRIGYVPQYAQLDPFFPVNVMDVVLMGRLGVSGMLGPYHASDREAALNALEQVNLRREAMQPFGALSGGQRQRVLIARALAGEPQLLMMDEPTAHLDVHMEAEFYDLLRALSRRLTMVLVSHDIGVVSQLVQTVICVYRRVDVHSTTELTGDMISNMYAGDVRLVKHDHHHDANCTHPEHRH